MKKAASIMILVLLAATMLTACSDHKSGGGGAPVISAAGGEGTAGSGGYGANFDISVYDAAHIKITSSGSANTEIDLAPMKKALDAYEFYFGSEVYTADSSTTIKCYPSLPEGIADDTLVPDNAIHTHGTYTYTAIGGCWDGAAYYDCPAWDYNPNVYRHDPDLDDVQVEGIHVMPGVTLTFAPNNDWWIGTDFATYGLYEASIYLPYDLQNEGTIKTLDLAAGANEVGNTARLTDGRSIDMSDLWIDVGWGSFMNTGTIVTKGSNTTAAADGGYGGDVEIDAYESFVNKGTIDTAGGNGGGAYGGSGGMLDIDADIVANSGTFITSGGTGPTNGNDAGDIDIWAYYGVYNSGPITAKGGAGTAGTGGWGGALDVITDGYLAPIANSGTINTSGADGGAGGGDGDYVDFHTGDGSYAGGDVVNTGAIISNGGNATVEGGGGAGTNSWDGSYSEWSSEGGNVRNSGVFEAKGGNARGAGYSGGDGGALEVWTDPSDDRDYCLVVSGSVQFSGSIFISGGSGENGGDAGWLAFYNMGNWTGSYASTVELLGYSNIDLKGGPGHDVGGNAGYAMLMLWPFGDWNYGFPTALGTIYNNVNFDISGGNSAAGNGGSGGYFVAENYHDWAYSNWDDYANIAVKPGSKADQSSSTVGIENYGNITTKGGQGLLQGGGTNSYYSSWSFYSSKTDHSILFMTGRSIINAGSLNASGGPATDSASGAGGGSEGVTFFALGNITNSGSIVTSGGNGPFTGGYAGAVGISSEYGMNTNSGSITANGGSANASLTGSTGRDGNTIEIYTDMGPIEATSTGTLTSTGGTGEASSGVDGDIYVGWW